MSISNINRIGANSLTNMIPTHLAVMIVNELSEKGIPSQKLLRGTGLKKEKLLNGEDYLTLGEMLSLINNALNLYPDSGLGLRIGASETVSSLGVLGYALLSCSTEKEAIKIGLRFHEAASSTMYIDATEDGDRLKIQLTGIVPLGAALPFCVEENIMGMYAMSAQFAPDPVKLLEIHLSYYEPEYSHLYEEYFGCPILYDQPNNIFWTRLPTNKPLQHADPVSANLSINIVKQLVEKYTFEDDLIVQIKKILLRSSIMSTDMNYVADVLSVSSRTLHRKLKDLGFSFKEIVEELRENLAIDYLTQSQIPVSEISRLLGYSDESSFRRAFKKWTGNNPSYYR